MSSNISIALDCFDAAGARLTLQAKLEEVDSRLGSGDPRITPALRATWEQYRLQLKNSIAAFDAAMSPNGQG